MAVSIAATVVVPGTSGHVHGSRPADAAPAQVAEGEYHVQVVRDLPGGGTPWDQRPIVRGGDGRMWTPTGGSGDPASLLAFEPSGAVTSYPTPEFPFAMAVGPDGNVWTAGRAVITRVSPSGASTVFDLPAFAGDPYGPSVVTSIEVADNGVAWYIRGDNVIGSVSTTGQVTEAVLPGGPGFVRGMTRGPDGAVWFGHGSSIGRIASDGTITTSPGPQTGVSDLVFAADGVLWTVGWSGLGRVLPGGEAETVVLTNPQLQSVAIAPNGRVWVTGTYESVGEYAGGDAIEWHGTNGRTTADIATGEDGYLWFTTNDEATVSKVSWAPDPTGEFTGVTPSRILDTRDGTGRGGMVAPVGPGGTVSLQVTGRGGVPSTGVSAVVANVTAVAPSAASYLTIWPTGRARPLISNLNFRGGQTVPNLVTVGLGTDGRIDLFNAVGATNVLVDVVGYYAARDGHFGARFQTVEPARLFDTRSGAGGVAARSLGAGESLRFDVTGKAGVPPAGVEGVVMNVTVTEPTGWGYLTVHPGDGPPPHASNLNFQPGQTVPNLVTVSVPASGVVSFFNPAGSSHVVADVVGYYTAGRSGPAAGRFVPVTPARVLDSRSGPGIGWGATSPVLPTDQWFTREVPEAGVGVESVVLNTTVTQPTLAGYLTVFSGDRCSPPGVSNLNFVAGETVPNQVITRVARGTGCAIGPGWVSMYNAVGHVHVVVDVFGYFARDGM